MPSFLTTLVAVPPRCCRTPSSLPAIVSAGFSPIRSTRTIHYSPLRNSCRSHQLVGAAVTRAPFHSALYCRFSTQSQVSQALSQQQRRQQRSYSTTPPTKPDTNHSNKYHNNQQLHSQNHPDHHHHHRVAITLSISPVFVTLACLAFIYYESLDKLELLHPEEGPFYDEPMDIPPGRPGNLTPEQEERLRRLWTAIFKLCNVASAPELVSMMAGANMSPPTLSARSTMPLSSPMEDGSGDKQLQAKPKKKFGGFFSRKSPSSKDLAGAAAADDSDAQSDIIAPTPINHPASAPVSGHTTPMPDAAGDDKYGQTKQFLETLEKQSPESIRDTIWGMVKHDNPDALVLRFLRARKWDVDKALVMLISTMNWRQEQMKVDEVIMLEGEQLLTEQEKAADGEGTVSAEKKRLAADFMAQIRMGKSFLNGIDKHGRPICLVRVRMHKAGEQCEESLERYTVYLIETARMLLAPPVDTATIVFDMTSFSVANMDYAPVKFMIKCFEANYPESLGAVLVHKAPWVFQGIWKIIRTWLDPVVASKVHFTNSAKDLANFIPESHLISELDGPRDYSYAYVEPKAGENDRMKDTVTKDRLLKEREDMVREFEKKTIEWVCRPDDEGVGRERAEIAERLRKGYWVLDPYVRARSFYDRTGVLADGGVVTAYPGEKEKAVSVVGSRKSGSVKERKSGEGEKADAGEITVVSVTSNGGVGEKVGTDRKKPVAVAVAATTAEDID